MQEIMGETDFSVNNFKITENPTFHNFKVIEIEPNNDTVDL